MSFLIIIKISFCRYLFFLYVYTFFTTARIWAS